MTAGLAQKDVSDELRKWLTDRGLTQSAFARNIGIGKHSVLRAVTGHGVSPAVAKAISDATDGLIDAWDLVRRPSGRMRRLSQPRTSIFDESKDKPNEQ